MGYHFSYHFELWSLSFVLEHPTNEHVRSIHLPDLQQLDALATKLVTSKSTSQHKKSLEYKNMLRINHIYLMNCSESNIAKINNLSLSLYLS